MAIISKSSIRHYIAVALLLIASLFPVWSVRRCQYRDPLSDDGYITLTYAQALSANKGFVFNQPPPTLGTTTPLLALATAGVSAILPKLEITTVALLLTALCWIGTAWTFFLFRHSFDITEWQAAIIGLMTIVSGRTNFLGAEIYLFQFLLVLSFALFLSKRWLLAGITTGFLFLARGEGVLALLVLIIYSLISEVIKSSRIHIKTIKPIIHLVMGFSAVFLVWLVYAFFTFGYFLPNTLSAKMAQLRSGLWKPFPTVLVENWIPEWSRWLAPSIVPNTLPFLSLPWFLVAIGIISTVRKKRKWLIFLSWGMAYIVGYTLLGVAAYPWYRLPVTFILQILLALGLIASVEFTSELSNRHGMKLRIVGRAASTVLVGIVIAAIGMQSIDRALEYPSDPRRESYLGLCNWIRENTQPSESIAYIEIGFLGYYTDNRIIDLAGLTTPEITPHVADGDFAWGFWYNEPDYYIYLPDFDWALAGIQADPRFSQQYKQIATLRGPREADFTIYKRVQ
jgi:hypothetical protein